MSWPPTLDELKLDMISSSSAGAVDRDDQRLQQVLDAAVVFVQRVRRGFDYNADPQCDLPAPPPDLVLGTLRLAARWHARRRSPDALIDAGDLGTSRVPSFDPDIERLLGIGRYRGPVFA